MALRARRRLLKLQLLSGRFCSLPQPDKCFIQSITVRIHEQTDRWQWNVAFVGAFKRSATAAEAERVVKRLLSTPRWKSPQDRRYARALTTSSRNEYQCWCSVPMPSSSKERHIYRATARM